MVKFASTLLEVSCAVVKVAIDWLEKQENAKVMWCSYISIVYPPLFIFMQTLMNVKELMIVNSNALTQWALITVLVNLVSC